VIQRIWQRNHERRSSSSVPSGPPGVTDVAFLGGITAYYVPAHDTLYVNYGPTTIAGKIPDSDPSELGSEDDPRKVNRLGCRPRGSVACLLRLTCPLQGLCHAELGDGLDE
jgi:hypothetical protein